MNIFIRMDLGEGGWGDVDWIGLSKDRNMWRALVNSVLLYYIIIIIIIFCKSS
jgi:hypothetical protein